MNYSAQAGLIQYLQDELLVPADAISLAIRQQPNFSSQLPIILWQFGFISLKQLNQAFEWLEDDKSPSDLEIGQAA